MTSPMTSKDSKLTLAEKVWRDHVVSQGEGDQPDLIFIDLQLLHEVTSPQAFDGLRMAGRTLRHPELHLATEDHNVPTEGIHNGSLLEINDLVSRTQVETLRKNCEEFGVRLHAMGDKKQGIVHQVGPQLGATQPGMTIVCGDSHTSTHGAFGAMAFGIGTSEVEHVMATQTLSLKPFKTMAINVTGELQPGVTAKDLILAVIATIGTGGGQGHVIEYRGEAIEKLSMEARMTVCNMSIEAGARAGMIAPRRDHIRLHQRPRNGAHRPRLGRRRGLLEDPAHRRRSRIRYRNHYRRLRDHTIYHMGNKPRPRPTAVKRRALARGLPRR